jgi:hypothetical protein
MKKRRGTDTHYQQRDEDEHSFPFSDLRRSELDDETMQDYTFRMQRTEVWLGRRAPTILRTRDSICPFSTK